MTLRTAFDTSIRWCTAPLGEVAAVQTGVAKGKKLKNGAVSLPYLRVANVQDGFLDLAHIKEIEIEPAEASRYQLRAGDVLFTEGGDFDKLGRGTVWRGQIDPCLHQNHIFAVRPHEGALLPEFLAYVAASLIGRRYFVACSKQSTNLASINSTQLKQFPIPLPPLSEQRRIAAILATWDAAIEKAERLTRLAADALSARRILLLSARHNRNRTKWRTVTFGDVTEDLTSRNGGHLTTASVMGVIKGDGFQPMRERTIGSDLSRYKVVPPSAFAYNPMRLNIGSLAFSGFTTDILVSPDYVVFAAKRDACAPEFLNEVRQSSRWAAWCQQGGAGSVRTRIYYGDLIGMPIDLPPLATQKRIAAILADLTTRHRTAVRRAELLRRQKTGLMQKLLTGKIRVPESVADLSPAAD